MFTLLVMACLFFSSKGAYLNYNQPMLSYTLEDNQNIGFSAPADNHKQFYTFSAPEEEFNDSQNIAEVLNSMKQNLRVLFIKAPEHLGLEDAAVRLASSVASQQTVIYVLNKQTDISELANKLQDVKSASSSTPEVHFVKYHTQAEAAHVQHAIQAQYENLPGTAGTLQQKLAPVLNYASKSPVAAS